jgi:type IV pilus assembly protein PilB
MGAEPYLVASSLIGVIAQRLVRLNCPNCRAPVQEKQVAMEEIGIHPEDLNGQKLMAGMGCSECRNVGFRGRSGIYEMLTVDDSIRQMITHRDPANAIKQYAIHNQGMTTLLQDGRNRVLNGETTIKEVLRVCQREDFQN